MYSNAIYKKIYLKSLLLCLLLSLSYITNNTITSYIGIAFFVVLFLSSASFDLPLFYISIMPLLASLKVNGIRILFLFVLISIAKLIFDHHKANVPKLWPICFLYIVAIEIIYDLLNWNVGSFLNLFSVIVYVLLLIGFYPWEDVEYRLFVNCLLISCFLCIGLTVLSAAINGIDLLSYITTNESYVRLGEDAFSHSLGGAMGIPIYAMMIISCIYIKLVTEKDKRFINNIFLTLIMVSAGFLGLLTHTRSFILGLIAFALCIILTNLFYYNKKGFTAIGLLLCVFVVIYFNYDEWIRGILSLFQDRGSWLDNIRRTVWSDIFYYWSFHPTSLLFGLGAKNYTILGKNQNLLFYMCAHNIILDGLMSWGIIGFFLFVSCLSNVYKRMRINNRFKQNVLFFIPLIVWIVMKMTSGTFEDAYEYFFIIALVCIAAHNIPGNLRPCTY